MQRGILRYERVMHTVLQFMLLRYKKACNHDSSHIVCV